MQAGLWRFGTDFGNGQADQLLFPRDVSAVRLVEEKARVLSAHPGRTASSVQTQAERDALVAARAWLEQTLSREGHAIPGGLSLEELAPRIAEDFVVLHHPLGGVDRSVFVHVCFPSSWRPEHILGKSFLQIHAPVPAFGAVERAASSLTEGMVTRGPYVRFVWTISADDFLDHHPEQGTREAWTPHTPRGFLRVERQATVPLPSERAAIFIIRTYLYGFEELTEQQRATLRSALELMPPEHVRYKGLEAAVPRARELLTAQAQSSQVPTMRSDSNIPTGHDS
jgi:dimethylamine monooxygenase subunit A